MRPREQAEKERKKKTQNTRGVTFDVVVVLATLV